MALGKKSKIKWTDLERMFEKEYDKNTRIAMMGLIDPAVKEAAREYVRSAWEKDCADNYQELMITDAHECSPFALLGRAMAGSFLTMYSVGVGGMPESVKETATKNGMLNDKDLSELERKAAELVKRKGRD